MSIGIGNLLNMFLHNGATNTVKAGVLHRSDPPQAILVESQADLEHLGEVPAGSIAYTAGYSSMWQLSAAGSWEEIQEEGGSGGGGGAMLLTVTKSEHTSATYYSLNKTWKEIKDALAEGTQMLLYGEGTGENAGLYAQFTVGGVAVHDGIYMVINSGVFGSYESIVIGAESPFTTTTSEDGYPMVVINN